VFAVLVVVTEGVELAVVGAFAGVAESIYQTPAITIIAKRMIPRALLVIKKAKIDWINMYRF
jgi:hypothetical protein